ncbi:helix-turn-helix transcriptional regulator [Lactobacillus johnsonii]|uniref:helix-turn-helix transcriptional regulator n=1 Tax=Lactobacillus johnsonii TaxID=33959 RepID=UPI001FB489F6|nr:helix-turn-helix transcriptional regulator [Lactobacillus johnsonii]UOC05489.1 helix-turn-helix domain-containing protein [Lactobacillus johnsonii]
MKNRLVELRMDKSWSQVEFAKKFNDYVKKDGPFKPHDKTGKIKQITYSTVSRWENGSVTIPTIYLDSLADFFGVTVSYLLGLSSRKQIKNRIRDVRIQKRMSQKELADKIQMTQQAISLYEQGIREPSLEIWQKLENCLDVSIPYLQGYPFAKCHWCGNEFVLVDKKDRDMYFYCPYYGRSPLDFGDKKPSAETKNHDEKQNFLKLENEKDTLDDAIEFLNELIGTSENLTNVGKAELTKVVQVLCNIYYDDTHACWKTK